MTIIAIKLAIYAKFITKMEDNAQNVLITIIWCILENVFFKNNVNQDKF